MKLVSYRSDTSTASRSRPGAVVDDTVVDLSSLGQTVEELIGAQNRERITALIASGEHRVPISSVTFGPPVRPRTFFALGLNYADHVAETGQEMPTAMTVFFKAPSSVTGPYDPVERPVVSGALDYEGELGVVIGTRCRHVTADRAPDVIAGYTVVNDVSVRDWQIMTPQWSLGKSFDTHGPIGPYLVTGDEVGDPHALDIRTFVNGELRQSSNTSNLIFDCFRAVEILSQACTLEPGDVIATGTPSGVAAGMPGMPWLVVGDRVRVEIESLGAIENQIVAELAPEGFSIDPSWTGEMSLPQA